MQPRSYKFRIYPNKFQRVQLQTHLHLSKILWNDMLELTKQTYSGYGYFATSKSLGELAKTSGLYSQTAQEIYKRLNKSISNMLAKKKKGIKAGFPRFKKLIKSLTYPQSGFKFIGTKKLQVTPFGKINIKKHRETNGKIKTLCIKREFSGKWFAIFTVEEENPSPAVNSGSKIGLDLGLMNFATLSDGTVIKNPRHLKKYEEKLRNKQRRLSRKKKSSSNRKKAKKKLAIIHEKVANTRKEFLHKLSHQLIHAHSLIAAEDLQTQSLSEQKYGKQINDAAWNEFIKMLSYKAERAGSKVILVNPENTTKECSSCGVLTKKELWERQHNCLSCGLSLDRDLNAAINILNKATPGTGESKARGDVPIRTSLKQDATGFIPW